LGEKANAYRILLGKLQGKRPIGRPRCKWEDNIKTDIGEIKCGMDYIHLAQDRDQWRAPVNTAKNDRVP
jgi:hypothetical protein